MVGRPDFHVFTGGPGAGKTSVLDALREKGFACVEESGRKIIREQQAIGGNIHHNGDRIAYRDLMLERAIEDFERLSAQAGPVFFDRGIPDLAGYCRLIGTDISAHLREALKRYRYNPNVFVFPLWPEIYARDSERRQDFREAIDTCKAIAESLPEFGYRAVNVPRASVEDRARFILQNLS